VKKFLAIYLGSPDAVARAKWNELSEPKRKELEASGIQAWGNWMAKHHAAVVDSGGPLGKTKRAGREGIADTKNAMTGYVLVQAESHEAAAQLFQSHPHFTVFPGEAVEIMEVLPIPNQR
jgi:hypothetical protein